MEYDPKPLSAQVLINCVKETDPCNEFRDSNLMTEALDIVKSKGLPLESELPFTSYTTSAKGPCAQNFTYEDGAATPVTIKSWTKLDATNPAALVKNMKGQLVNNNPLLAVVPLTHDLLFMKSEKRSASRGVKAVMDYGKIALLITGYKNLDDDDVQWNVTTGYGKSWGYQGNGTVKGSETSFTEVYQFDMPAASE